MARTHKDGQKDVRGGSRQNWQASTIPGIRSFSTSVPSHDKFSGAQRAVRRIRINPILSSERADDPSTLTHHICSLWARMRSKSKARIAGVATAHHSISSGLIRIGEWFTTRRGFAPRGAFGEPFGKPFDDGVVSSSAQSECPERLGFPRNLGTTFRRLWALQVVSSRFLPQGLRTTSPFGGRHT